MRAPQVAAAYPPPGVDPPAGGPYSPSQVTEMLREAANMPANQWVDGQRLVTLEPDPEGNYQITPAPGDNLSGPYEDTAAEDEADDHRQVVFLDAWALLGAR